MLVLVLLYVYGRLSRNAERFATITGKGFRPRPFDLGRLRYVAAAVLVFNFVLLLLVPMLMLVWVSLLPFFQPVSAAAFKLISLNNYRTVLASDHLELVINTLHRRGRDRDDRGRAHLPRRPGSRCGARRAAGWSSGWPPSRWCFPA